MGRGNSDGNRHQKIWPGWCCHGDGTQSVNSGGNFEYTIGTETYLNRL